ncbi:MAG: hypothetical protein JXA73_21230 [Acidobacteria bacterium]|nr:hypothetical protein [Acidobacteriota bacterium]
MIRIPLLLWLAFIGHSPEQPQSKPQSDSRPIDKSAYFAFVDHDYIFTVEVVKPGILLLNFVSMSDGEIRLFARDIRITLDNRKTTVKLLTVETGDIRQPMSVGSMNIRPRSSFGVRLTGDFGQAQQIFGAAIRLGDEDLKLAPLTSFDFEFLAARVNRLNLGSPDFSEDWRVLRLEKLGSRSPAGRRER